MYVFNFKGCGYHKADSSFDPVYNFIMWLHPDVTDQDETSTNCSIITSTKQYQIKNATVALPYV